MLDILWMLFPLKWLVAAAVVVVLLLRRSRPAPQPAAQPRSLAPVRAARSTDPLPREIQLQLIRAEVARAFHCGEIQRETYQDIKRCLDLQQSRLPGSAVDAPPPQPSPQESLGSAPPPRPDTQPAHARIAARVHPQPENIPAADGGKEEALAPLAGAAPHAAPDQPATPPDDSVAEAEPHSETVAFTPAIPVQKDEPLVETPARITPPLPPTSPRPLRVSPRSWTERLFTPENVRILQSLGIGIIFLSAVAFVHAQMWNGASGFTQLLLLATGTACCTGLGLLLLRFTHLRLTALCFLILGQLSILVDLYAVRVFDGPSGGIFFNRVSESQWWMLGFAVFSVTAYVQSRFTKELLFDAFTYFGALAAWGAGMLWLDANIFLLPASFVPVLLASSLLAAPRHKGDPLKRWSLPWWLQSGVALTAPVFCAALPLAALWSGQHQLAADILWHAGAILLLAAVLFKDAWNANAGRAANVPAVLLLSIAPLAVYAHSGLNGNGDLWAVSLALPGLLLAALGLAALQFQPLRKEPTRHVAFWGTFAAGLAFALAILFAVGSSATPLLVVTAAAAFTLAILRAVVLREAAAAWLATAAAAFALNEVFALQKFAAEDTPLGGLLLAGTLYVFWFVIGKQWNTHTPVARAGRTAADVLTVLAAIGLVLITPFAGFLLTTPLNVSLRLAWLLLAAYILSTSLIAKTPLRRTLGVLLLAPAVMPPQLFGASSYFAQAPWLVAVAGGSIGFVWALHRREGDVKLLRAGLTGSALMIGYAASMAFLQGAFHSTLGGGISLILLASLLSAQALVVRGALDHLRRALLGETLALLLLAAGFVFLAAHLGVHGAEWSPALALIAALTLLAGLALESLAGAWLGERASTSPSAYLESRGIAVALIAACALLCVQFGRALEMPWLDKTWRTLFSVSLLGLYFTLARSSRDEAQNRSVRILAAALSYVVLIPGTYLLFLKSQSTGSSWGALWFLALAPVLMTAAYVQRRDREAALSRLACAGAGLVAAGSLLLAFVGNRANLAAVPCATLLSIGALAFITRRATAERLWTSAALVALTGGAFYGLRAACGDPAWTAFAPNPWEMPFLGTLGLAALATGWRGNLDPLTGRPAISRVALHGFALTLLSALWAFVLLVQYGSGTTVSVRLDMLIVSIALLAPAFLMAQRALEFKSGRHAGAASAALAYVMQMWKAQPEAWEWYTLPLALFLFAWAWELARSDEGVGPAELNGVLGLGCAFSLLPSFIQGLPWNAHDLWHVLALAIIGFALVFAAMATRRKIPLLSASGSILLCLLIHAIYLAMKREMMLPVGGLISGFSVLAVASLFESRMNANVRSAVDRARAEARMFWTSWN